MRIRCLVVDDEPLAIDLIERHLSQFPDFTVTGKCRNIIEAVKILQTTPVDLIFLDIRMPEIDGINFLSEVKDPPPVILTTAYREYAVQAFELGVVDYLLKPISFLRFAKAIERFKALHNDKANGVGRLVTSDVPLVFKSGNELLRINATEILYIQSQKDYVNIITQNKKVLVRASMKSILSQLPANEFIQIHKSYIVPAMAIKSIASNQVILSSIKLPIGQSYKLALMRQFGNL